MFRKKDTDSEGSTGGAGILRRSVGEGAPTELPQMTSGFTPRASSARIAPMWAQPRALPEPRARPMRGLRRTREV